MLLICGEARYDLYQRLSSGVVDETLKAVWSAHLLKFSNIKARVAEIGFLWLGSLAGALCAFATQAVLARLLGPFAFGTFSAALATVVLLTPLAGFGVASYWLKVFGEEGWGGIRWLPGSYKFIGITSGCVVFTVLIWAQTGPHADETTRLLTLLSIYIPGQLAVILVSSKLQLEARHVSLALWQFLPHLGRMVGVIIVAIGISTFGTIDTALIYGSVAMISIVVALPSLARMMRGDFYLAGHRPLSPEHTNSADKPAVRVVANEAWPFGVGALFHLVYFQSDIVILKYVSGDTTAGIYNVCFVVMSGVYLFPSVVYQKYMVPKLHRWAYHDPKKLQWAFSLGVRSMAICGVIAAILVCLLAPVGVHMVFGPDYRQVVHILYLLAICIPIRFVATSVGALLLTADHMRRKVKCMGYTAAVNVAINFALIPKFGVYGAVVSTVVSEIMLLVVYYVVVKHYVLIKAGSEYVQS